MPKQQTHRQRLKTAISNGDTDEIRQILDDSKALRSDVLHQELLRFALAVSCDKTQTDCVRVVLDLGADPDTAEKSHKAPLFIAVRLENERIEPVPEIVQLLLDHGADVNGRGQDGRNALMWTKSFEVAEKLLDCATKRGSPDYINDRDDTGKTALVWAIIHGSSPELLKLLMRRSSDTTSTDDQGNTLLHFATMASNQAFAEALITEYKLDVNVTNHGRRTPLHLAAGKQTGDMAKLLLAHGGDLGIESSGGWLPLHVLCGSLQADTKMVEEILQKSDATHLIHPTYCGKTPIHIAAERGNIDVLTRLISRINETRVEAENSGDKSTHEMLLSAVRMQDDAGNIALFNEKICDVADIRNALAPWNLEGVAQSRIEADASKEFKATVVDFPPNGSGMHVSKPTVFDLIYTSPTDSKGFAHLVVRKKACKYRWIHLPANKRSWCRDLFSKRFIELWSVGGKDVHLFQTLARALNQQRVGSKAHSAYMMPVCQSIASATEDECGVYSIRETSVQASHLSDTELSASEHSSSRIRKQSKSSIGRHNEIVPADVLNGTARNFYLYMPYLHFEYFHDLRKVKNALSSAKDSSKALSPSSNGRYNYGTLPLNGLRGEDSDYHRRRTLDQFLYRDIDTDDRDKDQVAFRYQKDPRPNGMELGDDQCKVIMVDELWMWVISEDFVVTSFPERFQKAERDPFDVRECVLNRITAEGLGLVPTVYDLAALIARTCSEAFDFGYKAEPRFIDMFEASLGNAMEGAVTSSKTLNRASAQACKWLRTVNEDKDLTERQHLDLGYVQSPSNEEHSQAGMNFVDTLLDLRLETDIVYKISDIRDEMDILSIVTRYQQRVLRDLGAVLVGDSSGRDSAETRPRRRAVEAINASLRAANNTATELGRMEKQAKRIYETITNVLDIKQKYANAIEARSVRAGGLTIIIFTIATVFFLPASFIVSVFTLNLSSFPHKKGDPTLSPRQVFPWVLALGFGLAIVYLVLGLGVSDIRRWCTVRYRNFILNRRHRTQNNERINGWSSASSSGRLNLRLLSTRRQRHTAGLSNLKGEDAC